MARSVLLNPPRALSILCLTCINHGVRAGDAQHGNRKITHVCGAGVRTLRDRFSCDSYVRVFKVVPFLVEHDDQRRRVTRASDRRRAARAGPAGTRSDRREARPE